MSVNDLSSLFNIECKSTTKGDNTYSSKQSTSHINLSDSNGDGIDSKLPSTSESVELSDLDHKSSLDSGKSSLDSGKSENSSLSKSLSESGSERDKLNCDILKEQIFDDFDHDKSGQIEKDEFDKLILSIGEYNSNEINRLWDELIVNHDNKICFEEFGKMFDMDCNWKKLNSDQSSISESSNSKNSSEDKSLVQEPW